MHFVITFESFEISELRQMVGTSISIPVPTFVEKCYP